MKYLRLLVTDIGSTYHRFAASTDTNTVLHEVTLLYM